MNDSSDTRTPGLDRTLRAAASFRALADAAVDGIVVIDEDGVVESFNPAAEAMFGYDEAEVVGHNVSMLMPQPHQHRHDGYIRRFLETGQARIIGIGRETHARRKDGTVFPIDLSVGQTAPGDQRRFVGIIRDATERIRTAEQLRRREELLRQTLNGAPLGIATASLDGRFLSVNPACCEMLGYDPDEFASISLEHVTAPDQRDDARDILTRLARGETDAMVVEKRCVRKDGHEIHGRLHMGVVRGGTGEPAMLVVQVEDMTEKVRAREEARRRQNRLTHVTRLSTLGEMAAGIAHEINQPLTAIATYAEASRRLLESGNASRTDILDTLSKTGVQARRAGEVIRRVRALARRRADERSRSDLNDLVRDVVQLAEVDARLSGVSIDVQLEEQLPMVEIDPVQIQPVLLNLIRNGLESMGPHPQDNVLVVATAATDNDTVTVSVTDHGPGVPDDVLGSIFDPFFTTKPAGTGMGLSISRTIATAHGGNLVGVNAASGGAVFTLTLPTAVEERPVP